MKERRYEVMTKKVSILALFSAFAITLSYIESFIPVSGILGAKLGLANFAVIMAMYLLGNKEALFINIVRILFIGFMFGNLFSICFSIAGAVVSFIAMILLKYFKRFSMISVAVMGGVFHNIGQIIVAAFVVENISVVVYIPILIISGIVTGFIIGILSNSIYLRGKKYFLVLLDK